MAAENIDVVRRAIDALNRRDLDGLLAVCDPEIEFHSLLSDVVGAGGTFHGHDGIRDYMREQTEAFEQAEVEIERLRDRRGLVVAHVNGTALRRANRVEIRWRAVYAAVIANGSVQRAAFTSTEEQSIKVVGA